MTTVMTASVVAFGITVATLLTWRRLAGALDLIDRPGGHKTHYGEVPVVGGLAMFTGFAASAAIEFNGGQGITGLILICAFLVVMGAVDDRFNLRPTVRLPAHFAAAIMLVYVIHGDLNRLGNLFGFGSIPLGSFALPFTTVGVVTFINGFNMLDGLDGLASTAGLVGFIGITYLAGTHYLGPPRALAECLVGAIAAFSIFNLPLQFNRSLRTFMGDAGSTLLGCLFAALAIELTNGGAGIGMPVSPIVILWLIPLPIIEVFLTTFRRLARGMSLTGADNGHSHHVLLRSGFSVRGICLIYFLASTACAVFGIFADERRISHPELFVGFLLVIAAWTLLLANARRIVVWLPAPLRREDQPST